MSKTTFSSKSLKLALAAGAAAALLAPFAARADWSGDHPAYAHALADLREARWQLAHRPGDVAVSTNEAQALDEIDRAIDEAKHAAWTDGKDLENHVSPDVNTDERGRLHATVDLLHQAESDVNRQEDNRSARDDRERVLHHIDAAMDATERAIHDVERDR